jgi:hypothetical protein
MAERVLYRHAVEALFQRTLGQKLTPRAKTRLKEVGLDVANFGPEVPQPIWAKALRIACEAGWSGTRSGFDASPPEHVHRVVATEVARGASLQECGHLVEDEADQPTVIDRRAVQAQVELIALGV